MKNWAALTSFFVLFVTGCHKVEPQDYADKKPTLDVREYFNGPVEAWGILYNFRGKAELEFKVDMEGKWEGNKGTLKEDFTYSNGRQDQRIWTLEMQDDHHFTGTAADIVGVAKGAQYGNAVNMRYVLNVKRDNGEMIKLSMDDWLYKIDDKTLINRNKMRKFGLPVGELVISFRKR